ncbi:MAG: esterase-like activity of phytase family protein [Cyanobacteria bacterium P01_F01_bin.150]
MTQFNRVASFIVASQIDPNSNTDTETAAEIVTVSTDGNTLIYSDSPQEQIGLVDISNPSEPAGLGVFSVGGEPTSVAVLNNFALVAVNTSTDFINTSGQLVAVDISTPATPTITNTLDIGGQPDSIAVSPDGNYAVIAIENERDEDLGDGGLPQAPAGFAVVVDTSDADPNNWSTTQIDLTGLAGVSVPEDPEPEFVDISSNNIAAVTLQENNAIVLIDLAAGTVLRSFSAGTVDLTNVDTAEDGLIHQTASLNNVPREPDGITFIGTDYIATADEGDLDGGSRGFTIFDLNGNVVYTSGNEMDQIAAQVGHYPDERSENKGNEPENIEFASYDGKDYLFVNSERSSLVFVYDVADPTQPVFQQVLPAGVGPEGGKAIPDRNLLVVASEEDNRGDKIRSVINIYEASDDPAAYPTLQSNIGDNGVPIPWSAMSGLSAGPDNILYAVEDSFYNSNRFFTIDTSTTPSTLTQATMIKDTNSVFAAVAPFGDFSAEDLAALINDDNTVNIDPEGIAATDDGFVWIASEGSGTVGDENRPITSLNFLFKVGVEDGAIAEVVTLPDELNAIQVRFGLEGVAYDNGLLVAVLQRAWGDDPNPRVLVYDTNTSEWVGDYFYPLDAVESQNGGWVGLSDISPLGSDRFLVLERDNQGGPDAAIKRLYTINLSPDLQDGDTLEKTFVRDLIPDFAEAGGLTPEKLEGLAVDKNGVWVINDNDGVDDNSGETQLLNLGDLFPKQRVKGSNKKDRLIGSLGDDVLRGRKGNDRLVGGEGDDTLIGGRGSDRLIGGEGDDTFVFKRGDLRDRPDKILDFEVGSDMIDLQKVLRGNRFESDDPFADFVRIKGTGKRTRVQIDANGNKAGGPFETLAILKGVDADTVDSDSFLI